MILFYNLFLRRPMIWIWGMLGIFAVHFATGLQILSGKVYMLPEHMDQGLIEVSVITLAHMTLLFLLLRSFLKKGPKIGKVLNVVACAAAGLAIMGNIWGIVIGALVGYAACTLLRMTSAMFGKVLVIGYIVMFFVQSAAYHYNFEITLQYPFVHDVVTGYGVWIGAMALGVHAFLNLLIPFVKSKNKKGNKGKKPTIIRPQSNASPTPIAPPAAEVTSRSQRQKSRNNTGVFSTMSGRFLEKLDKMSRS